MPIHEHYLELYRDEGEPDGQGGIRSKWVRVDRLYGTATPRPGSLELDATGERKRRTWDISCPFHPLVRVGYRIHYLGKIFRIDSADDPDGRREALDLECEELIP